MHDAVPFAALVSEGRTTALVAIFRLTLRHRIWRVTLDNAFYGDYRTKHSALEGVGAARIALEASGRAVKIVWGSQ